MLPSRPLNTAAPLNRTHHLARDLELWWLALPHLARGYTWRDIAKGYDGTLTTFNLASTTRGWFSSPHASKFETLRFDATINARVATAVAIPCLAAGSTAFTLSGWTKRATTFSNSVLASQDNALSQGPFLLDSFGNVKAAIDSNHYGAATVSSTDLLWHHYTMVYNGAGSGDAGRLQFYFDGVAKTLSSNGAIPASIAAAGPLFYAGQSLSTASQSNADIDDIKVYSRPLSAEEALRLYRESLAGHPTLLNWLPSRRHVTAAASGNRRRRVICGGLV